MEVEALSVGKDTNPEIENKLGKKIDLGIILGRRGGDDTERPSATNRKLRCFLVGTFPGEQKVAGGFLQVTNKAF